MKPYNFVRSPFREKMEEDRWLDALEKGELDDTGGLKRKKNTKMMTARQVSKIIRSFNILSMSSFSHSI